MKYLEIKMMVILKASLGNLTAVQKIPAIQTDWNNNVKKALDTAKETEEVALKNRVL